jgi:hypothetical protein
MKPSLSSNGEAEGHNIRAHYVGTVDVTHHTEGHIITLKDTK